MYTNICRSLFEKHKLLFSFLLTIKILQGASQVDPLEWRFLISGMAPNRKELPNPDSTWIESNVWSEVCTMSGLPAFRDFPVSFTSSMRKWKDVFDSVEPQNMPFPAPFDGVQGIQRMCILRCLRRDKMMEVSEQRALPTPHVLAAGGGDARVLCRLPQFTQASSVAALSAD